MEKATAKKIDCLSVNDDGNRIIEEFTLHLRTTTGKVEDYLPTKSTRVSRQMISRLNQQTHLFISLF